MEVMEPETGIINEAISIANGEGDKPEKGEGQKFASKSKKH